MRNLMLCTPHQILLGNNVKKNEMGEACSKYSIDGFDGNT